MYSSKWQNKQFSRDACIGRKIIKKTEEMPPKKVRIILTSLREEVIVMRVGCQGPPGGGTQMFFL